jgi:hypothetical protein
MRSFGAGQCLPQALGGPAMSTLLFGQSRLLLLLLLILRLYPKFCSQAPALKLASFFSSCLVGDGSG